MQSDQPYCSRSYEHGREALVAPVRDAIADRGLTKADVLIPQDAPKEIRVGVAADPLRPGGLGGTKDGGSGVDLNDHDDVSPADGLE